MATVFSPTHGEVALVNQIFAKHDPQKFGIITGDLAVNIFGGANLNATTLSQIWGIADADNQGFLTRKGVSVAVRLLGWAQKGEAISAELVNKPGPLPLIDGFSSSAESRRAVSPSPKSPGTSRLPPPLTAQDKTKFAQYFSKCNPVNGLLSSDKAREVFVKSKLPVEQLSQIWKLSDTQSRGSLDAADFIVAMYLIQASMSGQLPFIPTTLPPGLYEMASDQTLPGSTVASHTTGNSGSFHHGMPGSFPQTGGPGIVQPQLTGKQLQPQYSGRPLQQQFTGPVAQNQTGSSARKAPVSAPFSTFTAPQSQLPWDVTATEKASADKHFDGLDTRKRGYIESDVAVPFMLQSNLPGTDLASIWDLADLNNDGRLTRDGFAVAYHLIQGKISGKEIPTTLPASLMPPSMRAVTVPTTSPFQQPPSDSLNDLLWEDSPVTSQPQSAILQPQRTGHTQSPPISASQTQGQIPLASNKDLLDDDDDDDAGPGASTTINNHSAEIGNVQNQLQAITGSLLKLSDERSKVEPAIQNKAAELPALQTQLSSAKAAFETESRLLATLRERYSDLASETQHVTSELISVESDLSAIRVEKAEIEQGLLHEKEEIRELRRKMTETGSTIIAIKAEIEKAKKEAKQQKGLLVVAKKQLAAREAEKAKASQELQEAAAEAQEATKEREIAEAALNMEATVINASNGLPFAPSPSLSGDSTAQPLQGSPGSPSSVSGSVTAKSNNPFERLAAGPGPQSPFLPFANSPVPTPLTVTSAQNEGTTTDNPFTFHQAFGDEEARPGLDVEEPSTGPERSLQPSPGKVVDEPRVAVNEEVSEPSSDHDLFTTPPTSALDTLGASAFTSPVEPDALKLPPPHTTSPAPSTDRPPEAHTDLNSQLKELDANESDSSDEDSEDETPLATLVSRPPPSNKAEVAKEAISNGHAMPQSNAEAVFPPVAAVDAFAETQSTNPFPPVPAKDSSPFLASTPPFAATPEPQKVATLSDFDTTFGDFPGTTPTAAGNNLSFDNAFEDQFDFTKAEPSTSLPGISVSSSGSSAFPPAPTSSGIVKPAITPVRDSGFESAYKPQQNTAGSARPVSAVDGLPVLPPVPESRPFSFVQAFSSDLSTAPALTTTAPTVTTPSQPPSAPDAPNPTFGDAFDLNGAQTDSGLGTASSRTSSIPLTQSPVSTVPPSNPVRGSTSPREAVSFPVSQPPPSSPPPRMTSPKGRPSTSSSKESGKEHGSRHSKLSIRLPFGRKKKTQESLPPSSSQHLSPIVDETVGRGSPAVGDDFEPVKHLCNMGFSRTQAVAALEANSYDFQKALNSLLNG